MQRLIELIATEYVGLDSYPKGVLSLYAKCRYLAEVCDNPPLSFLNDGKEHRVLKSHLVIFLHSIDGENVRTSDVQDMLSLLVKARRIHMVASVTHLNAHLMWNGEQYDRFNWIWKDVTAFLPSEIEMKNQVTTGYGANAASTRGIAYVLKSLTKRHIEALQVLSNFQESKGDQDMDFQDFYVKCFNDLVVSNEAMLRKLLVEFKDHKLVSVKREGGREYIRNLVPAAELEQTS